MTPSMLDWFLAFAASIYGGLTLCALALAIMAFFYSAKARVAVDAAIDGRSHRKPLGLFDLSRGDPAVALATHRLVVPERLWTYDEAYLERFAQAALHARTRRGSAALDDYVRVILRGLDLYLAVGLGAFVVLVNLTIADFLADPLWARAAWIGACMGLVYAVADIGEDLKLASILGRAATAGDDAIGAIDPGEAAAANLLTRVKLVSITLSGVGMALVAVLSAIAAVVIPPPNDPAPEGVPVRVGAD